jgi:hypothetical protein
MGNIYLTRLFRHSTLWITACSFIGGSLAASLPASYEFETQLKAVNLNDVAFIARIEKLYEKVKRYKDKLESEKLIETMFDIKMEVEGYTGKKIDLENHLNQIEKEAKKKGAKFKSGEIKQIAKMLKKKGKKRNHKALYLYECNIYNIPFDQLECDYLYQASKHDKKDEKEDKEEIEVPLRLSVGVTASLCGYFLGFVPHPYCQAASKFLIGIGLEMCVEAAVSRTEEEQNEKGQKKKS